MKKFEVTLVINSDEGIDENNLWSIFDKYGYKAIECMHGDTDVYIDDVYVREITDVKDE